MPNSNKNKKTKTTKHKKTSLLKKVNFSKPVLITFVVVFAAIGGYAIYRSFAAGGTQLSALYAIEDSASSATKFSATTCAQLSSQAANPTAREVDVSAMTCPGQVNFSATPSSTVKYVFASGVKFTGSPVGSTSIGIYVSGSNLILWGPADVSNPSDDGIRVEGASNIVIGGGIKTHDNGTQGILVQQESSNVWLDGLEATNNGTHAACVSSGLCTSAEPNYDLSGDHGIYWGDGVTGGGVVNSYIHDQPNGYCIEAYQGNTAGSGSIFAFNTLARCSSPGEVGGDSGGLGAYFYSAGTNQTFVGNVVTGTRFAGLGSHSTTGTAKGNVFWSTGTQGDIYNDSAPNLTVSDSHDVNPMLDANDRPQASSPLTNIDSAYAATYLPRTDFTGATRTTADAGAFAVPGASSCSQTVSAGANLATTITNAAAGSTVCLGAGSYAGFTLSSLTKTSNVTIQPVAGAAVTITSQMSVTDSSHLVFTGSGGTMNVAGSESGGCINNITFSYINWTAPANFGLGCAVTGDLIDHDTFSNLPPGDFEARLNITGSHTADGFIVSNSLFSGQGPGGICSDGIDIEGPHGVQIGPGNEFTNMPESICSNGVHTDPIQPSEAVGLIITGNYFHDNGDGSGGCMCQAEAPGQANSDMVVTNNVFASNGYVWSIYLGGEDGAVVEHNVFAADVGFGSANGDDPSGDLVQDNIFLPGSDGISDNSGPAHAGWTSNHNLNSGWTETGGVTGTPIFTGGASPTTFAGYQLASNSPGHAAASDGKDMGVDFTSLGTVPSLPSVTLSGSPTTVVSGSSSTLTWSSSNTTSCTASGSWSGSKSTSGSASTGTLTNTGSSSSTNTYNISCTGSSGTANSSATVTINPVGLITIGDTSIESSSDSGNGNLLVAQSATLSQTATIKSLSFYVTTAAGNLRLGIYDSSGPSGGPGALKAATAEITPASGWNTANVISQVSLPAGTYWLAYLPSSNSLSFVKTTDGTSSGKFYSFTYAALPTTFSTSPTSTATHWSFYATLNTGSGGSSVPGDTNGDGHVTITDLSTFLSNYGTTAASCDFNGDGHVTILDLSILLSHYGT